MYILLLKLCLSIFLIFVAVVFFFEGQKLTRELATLVNDDPGRHVALGENTVLGGVETKYMNT